MIVSQTFTPKVWTRFVDGTVAVVGTNKPSDFLMALNSALSRIQFTLDKEKDCNLPFHSILMHLLPKRTLEIHTF